MQLPKLNATVIECGDVRSWLAERKNRIQASDGAGVLGESGWASRVSIYADKTTDVPEVLETSEEWEDGHEQEPIVCNRYARKFNARVTRWPEYTIVAARDYPWLGCTPDAIVEEDDRPGPGVMQIKSWSEYDRDSWANGTPVDIQIQNQIEILCTGLLWGVVAVKLGRIVERFYTEPNRAFIAAILPLLRDFWTLVELRQQPEADESAATTRALAKLHPKDNGKTLQLSESFDDRLDRLRRLKKLKGRINDRIRGVENELKSAIGNNTYCTTPGGQWARWKTVTRDEYFVEATDYRELQIDVNPPKRIEYAPETPAPIAVPRIPYPVDRSLLLTQG